MNKKLLIFLLLSFPLLVAAQEKVFYNAKIFTANAQSPYAEAIAWKGKIIIAVGSVDEVRKAVGKNAEWTDLNGGFVMPGFVDSHIHAIGGGRTLVKSYLDDKLVTIDELADFAAKELKRKEGMTGDVLLIYGINISTWSFLDKVIDVFNSNEYTTQPVVLRGSDGHTSWCNKVMQQRAGITKEFIQGVPEEDKIFYGTTANGEPNGFVSEKGFQKILTVLPAAIDYNKAAEKSMEYCNGLGITAFLDPAAGNLTSDKTYTFLEQYKHLIQAKKLTAHVSACVVADADGDPQTQIARLRKWQQQYDGYNFSIKGFKIFADGVIEHPTHTAALSVPYTGTDSKGVLMFDPKKFARFAIAADREKLLVHVHAIGDRAVTETLNGIEAARKVNRNFTIPHSITHLQIVLPSDFDRFKKLNVLVSYQLLWAFGDVTTVDIVKPFIDSSLYKWQYPARSLMQAGATICGASDWSVSSANPFTAIYRAETRKGPLGVLDSTQCMPRQAMLYAYTIESAKALMQEKNIGSLQAGKFADMILLDRDILTVSPEEMRDTKVLWTMFEGKKVYKAE